MNDPVLADRVRRLLWLEESQSTSSNSGEEFSDDAESESFIAPIDPMAVPNYPGQTCPICMDSVGLYPSPCCSFACCTPCWHLHISTAVNDGRVKVPCASNDCKKYLPKEFILNYIGADSQLHERFIKLYLIANQNPRSKTCESPLGLFVDVLIPLLQVHTARICTAWTPANTRRSRKKSNARSVRWSGAFVVRRRGTRRSRASNSSKAIDC